MSRLGGYVTCVLYGLSIAAASYGIGSNWGINGQLIFMPLALLGGIAVGRWSA